MKRINAFYDNSEFKDAEDSEPRNIVLSKSLAVEKYMSIYLSAIMDIENYLETKSFGNTSSALSFSQKLNLFTDLEYIAKEEKTKLISFSEIRNQFAHNSDCLTFEHAFNTEIKNRLKRFYPLLTATEITEKECKEVFELLYGDIKSIFERLRIEIYNKKINEFLLESMSLVLNETINNVRKNPQHFDLAKLNEIISKVTELISEKYDLNKDTFRTNVKLDIGKYLR